MNYNQSTRHLTLLQSIPAGFEDVLEGSPNEHPQIQRVPLAWMVEQRGPLIRFTLVQAMVLFRCPILTIQPPMVP